MTRPMILALCGPAGCGKSTAAAYLEEAHGFVRVRFAGPLKAMLRAFLAEAGTPPAEIERMIEGDRKQAPAPELAGRTPRYVMQTLGTEFGREMIHPDLWTMAWAAAARAALDRGVPGVVVEDCRFPNEVDAVRALGGTVVQIRRPVGALALDPHPSEGQALAVDATIANVGPLGDLCSMLDLIVCQARSAS
jgi:hypothetical protein